MSVQDDVLETATRVLLAAPAASLGQVARAAGMSRTSLHTRYPARLDLLVALAHRAMDLVERAYAGADLDPDQPVEEVTERLVDALLPLGARVEFLLRERSLDDVAEVTERYQRLDEPLRAWVAAAQARGHLSSGAPPRWVAGALLATVTTAWELVADGHLAPRDAPALVVATVLHGAGPR